MSVETVQTETGFLPVEKKSLYRAIGIMGGSAIFVSGAVIAFMNGLISYDVWDDVLSGVDLLAASVMPYLISAIIAAITAIAVVTIMPFFSLISIISRLHHRIYLLANGDLCSKIPVGKGSHHEVALTLNDAVDKLASRVSQLKGISRKQWDLLETIRISAQKDDLNNVMECITEMEENWAKLAKIEEQLIT
jgi:hypothetical protein